MSAICWKWARVYRAWLRSGTTVCRSCGLIVSLSLFGFSRLVCVYTATSAHFPLRSNSSPAHRPINLLSISLIFFLFLFSWWPLSSYDSWLGFRALAAIAVRWALDRRNQGAALLLFFRFFLIYNLVLLLFSSLFVLYIPPVCYTFDLHAHKSVSLIKGPTMGVTTRPKFCLVSSLLMGCVVDSCRPSRKRS